MRNNERIFRYIKKACGRTGKMTFTPGSMASEMPSARFTVPFTMYGSSTTVHYDIKYNVFKRNRSKEGSVGRTMVGTVMSSETTVSAMASARIAASTKKAVTQTLISARRR